jgi:hypothetical protein
MKDGHMKPGARARNTGLALMVAAALAGGALAGCGSDQSSVESNAKEQIEAGTKEAEEGVKEAQKEVQKAIGNSNGNSKKEIEAGLNAAKKGIQQGKAQANQIMEETKKKIEESTP